MDAKCDFCEAALLGGSAANVDLLDHLQTTPDCQEQFFFMVENLQASWTLSMSGP